MRRVAITGFGITSCLGNTREDVLDSLRNGRSGIAVIPGRKEMGFRSALAGKMPAFEITQVDRRTLRAMGQAPRMGVYAAHQALEHSGLPDELLKSDRTAMIIGHGGVAQDTYQQCFAFKEKGMKLGGTALQRVMNDTVSANLSVLLGTKGYSFTVSAACATGAAAIGQAYQLIGAGFQDRALAGGFMEDSWEYACNFDALKAFSMREDDPAASSRPFDRDRDGLVPSAGGSILILEELEAAQARGATIHAEIAGYSFSSDAKDMTAPSGEGGERAIRQALKDSGAERVDYINAHATATTVGDVVEAQVIARIFGDGPRVTSTKSMTGHEGAAAGSNEVVYTLLMMGADFIAPSLNLEHLDPQCEGIRVVTGDAIDADIRVAASNSFGFGGVNTCLVLTKP